MIAGAWRSARVAVFLAARSLTRGNASVTAMTVAMMAVVFISVVFLPSLINGAVSAIQRQVTDTTTSDLVITPDGATSIRRADGYLSALRETDGIAAAAATRRVGTQIGFDGESDAWGVDAVDPVSYAEVFTTPQNLIEGSWLTPGDRRGIVLGVDIAGADRDDLRGYAGSLKHVHTGDTVTVTLLGGDTADFVVRGIYSNSFVLSDSSAFITTQAADGLEPGPGPAESLETLLEAVGTLQDALATADQGADGIARAQRSLAAASDALAASLRQLSEQAAGLSDGASALAASASATRDGASELARSSAQLADGIGGLGSALGELASAAASSDRLAAQNASAAAALASSCPAQVGDPSRCAAEAELAESSARLAALVAGVRQGAEEAAGSARQLERAASGVSEAATGLNTAARQLARAAAEYADGTAGFAEATERARDAAATLAANAERAADEASRLAQGLRPVDTISRADRRALEDAVAAPAELPGPGTATRVFAKVDPGSSVQGALDRAETLRSGVEFQTSGELTASIQDQIDTFGLINDIMRVISLMVAAITVLILTYVELTNRRRQIGIERAIGIRSGAIVASYVLKSALSALIGVGLGLIAYRAAILPFVERHPFHFPNGDVVLVADPATTRANVALLVVVAVVAALIPTVNAIRMRILDAIWGR